MKTVKIQNFNEKDPNSIFTRDKYFRVSLGNGLSISFTNKKHLTKFLSETNEFIRRMLFELNKIYTEIFIEYRKMWFYFDGEKFGNISLRYDDDLIFVNKHFSMIVDRSGWQNGNHFVFGHFKNIIDIFEVIINDLIEVNKQKSNYVEKRNLEIILSRLAWITENLKNYGKNAQDS